ncbi:MAG: hypothetical protein U9R36_03765 [Elusimicrobiota bacterium]|nr:hypothetical protein [Elusimicrobiota bacterium]
MSLFFINIAYLFMLIAFILREVLYLRTALIIAHCGFIVYALITDNTSILAWNIVFLAINSVQAVIIIKERRPVELKPENEEIYNRDFSCMSRREFLYLWQTGMRKTAYSELILKSGTSRSDLFYIIKGTVALKKDSKIFTRLGPGGFVAEENIFSQSKVRIDVYAEGKVEYKVFAEEVLDNLRKLNPAALLKLEKILSRYMTAKLKTALHKK